MQELGWLLIVLFFLVLVIAASVPLFISLIVILALVVIVEHLKQSYEKNNKPEELKTIRSRFASSLTLSFLNGLKEAGQCVAVGLGLVVLCNAGFWMFRDNELYDHPDVLLGVENRLVSLCDHLKVWFKPNFVALILILIALLIVNKLAPKSGVLQLWKASQTFINHAVIVLTTISAFTFFTVEEVARQEPKWVGEMRSQVQFSLDEIGKERKRIMAEAIIEDRVERLPETSKTQLKQFFNVVAKRSDGKDIAGIVATVLEHSDSKLSGIAELLSPPKLHPIDNTVARASRWLEGGSTPLRITDIRAVYKEEFEEIEEESKGEADLKRTFFKEVLGGVLDAAVTDKMSEVVEQFLEIFVDSVSESIVDTIIPDAEDLTSAKRRTMNPKVEQLLVPPQPNDRVWNLQAPIHGYTVDVMVVRLGAYLKENPSAAPKTSREIEYEGMARELAETTKWLHEYEKQMGEEEGERYIEVP
jgi:hypothetical protein